MKNIWKALGITALLVLIAQKRTVKNEFKSYLGQANLPRGIRNNNPGNLIQSSIAWKGKIPIDKNTDGHFEQFENFPFGIRAMIIDVRNDILKGKDTLQKLITAYAPPSENNTEAYIKFMEQRTGLNRNSMLQTTQSSLNSIVKAIAEQENGKQYITDSDLNSAWSLLT